MLLIAARHQRHALDLRVDMVAFGKSEPLPGPPRHAGEQPWPALPWAGVQHRQNFVVTCARCIEDANGQAVQDRGVGLLRTR